METHALIFDFSQSLGMHGTSADSGSPNFDIGEVFLTELVILKFTLNFIVILTHAERLSLPVFPFFEHLNVLVLQKPSQLIYSDFRIEQSETID